MEALRRILISAHAGIPEKYNRILNFVFRGNFSWQAEQI